MTTVETGEWLCRCGRVLTDEIAACPNCLTRREHGEDLAVRQELVKRVRGEIADGTYETPGKVVVTVRRLLPAVTVDTRPGKPCVICGTEIPLSDETDTCVGCEIGG